MICKICKKKCKSETKHAFHSHNLTSKEYYDKFCKKLKDGVCLTCKKITKFKSFNKGYCLYCSDLCSSKDVNKNKKISITVSSIECQKKTTKTNFKKYGKPYYSQTDDYKKKYKKTCKKKYDSDFCTQNKKIKEKIKQTNLKRYGVENPGQSNKIKEKIKNTFIKKYGNESHFSNSEIQEKIKKYNLKKFGVEWRFQNNDIRNKSMYNGKYKLKFYKTKFNDEIRYQTKPELLFIKQCEFKNNRILNGDKIPYTFNNKHRVYFCDFKILEENGKWRLIEIKQKHRWWYKDLNSGKFKAKVKSSIKYSKLNGYLPYKIKFL